MGKEQKTRRNLGPSFGFVCFLSFFWSTSFLLLFFLFAVREACILRFFLFAQPADYTSWGKRKKERKKTDKPREGWEDGTPPPHRDFKERSVMR